MNKYIGIFIFNEDGSFKTTAYGEVLIKRSPSEDFGELVEVYLQFPTHRTLNGKIVVKERGAHITTENWAVLISKELNGVISEDDTELVEILPDLSTVWFSLDNSTPIGSCHFNIDYPNGTSGIIITEQPSGRFRSGHRLIVKSHVHRDYPQSIADGVFLLDDRLIIELLIPPRGGMVKEKYIRCEVPFLSKITDKATLACIVKRNIGEIGLIGILKSKLYQASAGYGLYVDTRFPDALLVKSDDEKLVLCFSSLHYENIERTVRTQINSSPLQEEDKIRIHQNFMCDILKVVRSTNSETIDDKLLDIYDRNISTLRTIRSCVGKLT